MLHVLQQRYDIEPTGCWVWYGPTQCGVPKTNLASDKRTPRHALYEEFYGRAIRCRRLVHLCETKLCVNPLHWTDDTATLVRARTSPPIPGGGCMEWTGERNKYGYGIIPRLGHPVVRSAHRVAWELTHGAIPEGITIDHLCNNPPCIRLDHLRLATMAENVTAAHSFTPSAMNKRKTHCDHGHEFNEENTFVYSSGRRACRTCIRRWGRNRYARLRGAPEEL